MIRLISRTFLTVLTVDLLATSGDVAFSWSSPVLPSLRSNDTDVNPLGAPITSDEETWIGSLISIGAMIGPLPYSFLSERFGRKIALLGVAIPHVCSYLILAFSQNIYLYYFARILGGCAVGGGYTILPMYVAEITEDSNRGAMSVTLNIFWTFGNLLPYVLGPYLSIMWFNVILAWIPFGFFIVFMIFAPETPYYLMSKGKSDEARKALAKLRSKSVNEISEEAKHIESVLQHDEHGRLMDIFKSRVYLKALAISLILIMTQQLSGINVILGYTQFIFEAASSHVSAVVSSMIIGFVNFVSSFITPFVADKIGRRLVLLASALGMSLSHVCLGVYFYLQESTDVDVSPIGFLPITSLVVYMVMFSVGFGSIPWTISSELFPSSVKGVSAPLISAVCWMTSFFITKFFNEMKYSLGDSGTFFVYGGCCVFGLFFTFFFVPETKGKSFKEIQQILEK